MCNAKAPNQNSTDNHLTDEVAPTCKFCGSVMTWVRIGRYRYGVCTNPDCPSWRDSEDN